jgi:Fe-S-cluster containining protein
MDLLLSLGKKIGLGRTKGCRIGAGKRKAALFFGALSARLLGMSNEEPSREADNLDWFRQLQEQLEQEAAHWLALGHPLNEDGFHDEEACRPCLETKAVVNDCRCGLCCTLLVEVDLEDAKREPKIAELGSPMYLPPELTASGEQELAGYILNMRDDCACVFLDKQTNLCQIHETRPLVCRLFNCEGEGREQLIELGIIKRE